MGFFFNIFNIFLNLDEKRKINSTILCEQFFFGKQSLLIECNPVESRDYVCWYNRLSKMGVTN